MSDKVNCPYIATMENGRVVYKKTSSVKEKVFAVALGFILGVIFVLIVLAIFVW